MENNRKIAEFMDIPIKKDMALYTWLQPYTNVLGQPLKNLKYHTSWDWLMPVVKKCYEFGELDNEHRESIVESLSGIINIEDTYEEVIKFIDWYNENK